MNGKAIGMDQLIIQTVLPYSLGDSNWIDVLRTQTKLGYNGFHFPPIQELGASGSYYAIKDQLKANAALFNGNASLEESMKALVQRLEKELNSLSFIDILLNHTSFDSPWLTESSNSVYSPENSPHLTVALLLDDSIQTFSDNLAKKAVAAYKNGSNRIENEDDLNLLMDIMKTDVFDAHPFADYFLFDIATVTKDYARALQAKSIQSIQLESEVEDDENIFSRSGFDIINIFIQENTVSLGNHPFLLYKSLLPFLFIS